MNFNDLAVCVANTQPLTKLKWFTFDQNNSGGSYIVNDKVDAYVIIQAHNADEANELAQRIGIYFNGVAEGYDCECCGNRWYRMYSDDQGTDEPEIYGNPIIWSPDAVPIRARPGKNYGLPKGVKMYPYDIISKR